MMIKSRALLSIVLSVINCYSGTYGFKSIVRSNKRTTIFVGQSLFSTVTPSGFTDTENDTKAPMPITVLSGFLGAGKTSFLQYALSNQAGQKFGLVVNDMATVNVDAKQIRQQSFGSEDGIDTMELQDGCVCCTLAEDLIASVSKLVSLSELKGEKYNHIVVECSGIAEPRKIRDLFQQAEDYGFELLKKIRLDTLVTLVDASVFLDLFGTDQDIADNRKLAYNDDISSGMSYNYIDGADQRKVTDLLLEQVECADIVLINKCDLLEKEEDLELVKKVILSINPSAKVLSCVRGEVTDPLSLVGSIGGVGAANWGMLDEHRNLVQAVEASSSAKSTQHSHSHNHSHSKEECHDATCTDPSHKHDHHAHSHSSSSSAATTAECHDTTCQDPTHNHDHSHSHSSSESLSSSSSDAVECHDSTCNDPTHNHDHSHSHAHGNADMTTALERFGITSFVYKRRKPFHPIRFSEFLQGLGKLSVNGIAEISTSKNNANSKQDDNDEQSADLIVARKALLRSKGFVWMATSKAAAYFVSHAGQYLELLVLGRWWADIPEVEWPADMANEITVDFSGNHGDRRQELVFIGQFGKEGTSKSQQALEKVLDSCLLTDEEMKEYEMIEPKGDDDLRDHFVPNF